MRPYGTSGLGVGFLLSLVVIYSYPVVARVPSRQSMRKISVHDLYLKSWVPSQLG